MTDLLGQLLELCNCKPSQGQTNPEKTLDFCANKQAKKKGPLQSENANSGTPRAD